MEESSCKFKASLGYLGNIPSLKKGGRVRGKYTGQSVFILGFWPENFWWIAGLDQMVCESLKTWVLLPC